MVKPQTIKRYRQLVRNLTAEQIQAVVEAQSAEEVKELLGKPEIKEETAKSYQSLIKNYYQATIAENPNRRETRIAQVNPVLTEEIRTANREVQRLRELTEQQQRVIEEMQRQMQAMLEEMQRLRENQQRTRTEEESNQRMIEESNELERLWLEQQGYETEPEQSREPIEPELDLEFEAPSPKIERYVRKGEKIIRIDQTPATGYNLSYFKDFGQIEESKLKVKMDIRLPEENKTITVFKDLGKVDSITQAKELVENEIEYQSGKYGGVVVGTRIYIVS